MSSKIENIINSVYSDNEIDYVYNNYNWTPSMIEWRSFKEAFQKEFGNNSIVLYQMGKFYETYFHDAYVFSKIVNVVLTKKNKSDPLSSPMSGVNMDFIGDKIDKLIEAGLYVIVVNQSENKHDNGQFIHELDRIYTPGMYASDNKSTNNILSIKEVDGTYHFTFLDILTTDCNTFIINKNEEHVILSLFSEYQPKEILIDNGVNISDIVEFQRKMPKYENATYIEPVVYEYDNNKYEYGVLSYANRLFINKEISGFIKNKITDYTKDTDNYSITLDINTIENLELLKTNNGDTENSLFNIINKTSTSGGQRLLKNILLHPLKSVSGIINRQKMVQELHGIGNDIKSDVYKKLLCIYDIDRIITKIGNHTVLPSDFILLNQSINAINELKNILLSSNIKNEHLLNHICRISDFSKLSALINDIFLDNPSSLIREGKIFKYGYNEELDHYIDLTERRSELLTEYVNTESKEIGVPLTYVENMQGIFINANIRQLGDKPIPKHWYRTRGTKVAERFNTDTLIQYHKESLVAEISRNKLEYSLFCSLRIATSLYINELRETSNAISWIDVLLSFEQLLNENYTYPQINDTNNLILLNAAHPVIEKIASNYIRNNVYLTDKSFKLLTGPNMGGKSVYLKLIGINTILAQAGLPISASFGEIGVCDNIFVRAGANDNFVKGQSTFFLEMEELSNIVKKAGKKSLVILDEIGRGTDTSDGFSIALASSEYFIENNIRTIFATHYHDLIESITEYKNAGNIYVDVQLLNDNLSFTHKIIEGNPETKNSYGIDIAKMAGLPDVIIQRSRKIKSII